MLNLLKKELSTLADKEKAKLLQRFFKTGKGEYGEGDIFLGLVVPIQRKLVAKYWKSLSISDIQELLNSKIHEHRLIALLTLVKKYENEEVHREEIFKLYLSNTRNINNWDLVDLSAPNIVGKFLLNRDRKILYALAKSSHLWERRISVLATFSFIREGDFNDSLKISEILLRDKHDLIHKAVGWMLREIGKRDEQALENFLDKHCNAMPRTMLRYSIERLPDKKREYYMTLR